MTASPLRILVLTGGSSAERDVAIASAAQVVTALRSRGHVVHVADTIEGVLDATAEARVLGGRVGTEPPDVGALEAEERRVLFAGLLDEPLIRQADVVFLALHGGRGEDGTIQHLLEVAGIPYTGSGPLASGLAMDKDVAKRLFETAGVPTAAWRMAPTDLTEAVASLGLPLVVKPSKQGSTVGLSVVREVAELVPAIAEAARHDDEVMLEAFVPGR